MKKHIMAGLLLVLGTYGAKAQYGFAAPQPITTVLGGSPSVINLSNCVPSGYFAGSIWNTATVDFTSSFTLDYDVAVQKVYASGADGYCVVFKQSNSLTAVGATAGYIGYYYGADFVNNSFAVEFDDFDNQGGIGDPTPYFDHIAIAKNASFAPGDILASPAPILPGGATIQDSVYHHYKIEWLCGLNTLNVYVDGNRQQHTDNFDYRALFTNPASVTWGFTSGIGQSGSNHLLKNVSMVRGASCLQKACVYNPKLIPSMTLSGATQFDLTPNAGGYVLIAGYIWDFGDGSPTVTTTGPTVTHTYTISSYTVTVKILGYNTLTGECCTYIYTYKNGRRMANPEATDSNSGISVAPNPGTGVFNIATADFKFNTLQVADLNGRKLIDIRCDATQLKNVDLSNYASGVYLLTVQDEKGSVHSEKLILTK